MIMLKIDPNNIDMKAIRIAADAIRRGELVIFPTETVYGLAADATNDDAIRHVFRAKGRAPKQPLPVQVVGVDSLAQAASFVSENAKYLADRYWPGPLTLVLPKSPGISNLVTGGKQTVGVRVPDHPVALALLKEVGGPIVATSANISGDKASMTAADAVSELGNDVSVVIDAGESRIGISSTVIDVSTVPPRLLRRGTISLEEIRDSLGDIDESGE